jgi:hypothetical protein
MPDWALKYVRQYGLKSASSYPYTSSSYTGDTWPSTCAGYSSPVATVSAYGTGTPCPAKGTIEAWLDAHGPIAIAMHADCSLLSKYTGGILTSDCLSAWDATTCSNKVSTCPLVSSTGNSGGADVGYVAWLHDRLTTP